MSLDGHGPAGFAGTAVAGETDELDLEVHLEVAHQIGQKNIGPLEYRHENQRLAGVIAIDLLGDLLDGGLDLKTTQIFGEIFFIDHGRAYPRGL